MLQLALLNMLFWVSIIGTGSVGAVFVARSWAKHRNSLTDDDVRRLFGSIEEIQQTLEDIRTEGELANRRADDRIGEVSGRVEFVERLLTEGKAVQD